MAEPQIEPQANGLAVGEERRLHRRPQLSDEVAAHLRESIMSGRVRQGEYLRLERIAEDLGTSATPVREALLALRGEGFVQLEPRRGFVVAPLSRQDVADIFLVQATIAAELAARAAKNITDEQVVELEGIQTALATAARARAVDDVEEYNFQFHRAINRLADSEKLSWFLNTAVRYMPRRFYASIAGWRQASVTDHLVIVAAMRARHPERARRAMHQHIIHVGELLVSHLDKQGMWARPEPSTPDGVAESRAATPAT